MQRSKDKSFSEIKGYCGDDNVLTQTFHKLLKEFNLTYINSLFSKVKTQGVDGKDIFRILFVLRFLNFNNIHQLMLSGISKDLAFRKDVLYDFLNNHKIDWRKIVLLFAKQVLNIIELKSEDKEITKGKRCIIIDDSILPKSGKTIEFIGKVFDHGTHIYQLGMKLLTVGYSDGKSFIPLDFSIHNEPGKQQKRGLREKDLKNQFSKIREEKTSGFQRQNEVSESKIEIALQSIKRLIKKGLQADYVLADSWFISENFIRSIKSFCKTIDVIGLMKVNRVVVIDNKRHKAQDVPEIYRNDIQYCKKLKCHYIKKKISFKDIEMIGYWVRMNGQENWSLLISTNQNLTFIKAMEVYQIRWSIEVFFRDCKQSLKINSCQSVHLDAHVATISLVFMNYMVLALKKRFEDYETLGELFRGFKEIMLRETLVQRIWTLIITLFNSVFAKLGVHWENFIQTIIEEQNIIIDNFHKTFENFFSLPTLSRS